MDRIKEILQRKAEINEILKDEKRSKAVDLKELEKEVRELNEELEEMQTRERLMKETEQIEKGEVQVRTVETFNPQQETEQRDLGTDSLEYRNEFMNYVLRGEANTTELHANALTKTTDVGSVIPQTVLNKIVEKIEAVGMILPLVTRTSIKGGVTLPTSSVKPVATWVAEGA